MTIETAPDFIQLAPPVWMECLEYSTELIKTNGKKVIPSIDHGRIEYFIKFWEKQACTPDWLHAVLSDLRPVFIVSLIKTKSVNHTIAKSDLISVTPRQVVPELFTELIKLK